MRRNVHARCEPAFCYGAHSPNPPRPLRATHLQAMNDKDRYWDCLDLAMEASNGGRTDEALAWLDEALKARPGGAEANNCRGEILWDEGRAEEALYQFELAMKADPNFLTAHLNLGAGDGDPLAIDDLPHQLAGGSHGERKLGLFVFAAPQRLVLAVGPALGACPHPPVAAGVDFQPEAAQGIRGHADGLAAAWTGE